MKKPTKTKLSIIHHTLKPDIPSSTQLLSTGTTFGAHFRSKPEVTPKIDPREKTHQNQTTHHPP